MAFKKKPNPEMEKASYGRFRVVTSRNTTIVSRSYATVGERLAAERYAHSQADGWSRQHYFADDQVSVVEEKGHY